MKDMTSHAGCPLTWTGRKAKDGARLCATCAHDVQVPFAPASGAEPSISR